MGRRQQATDEQILQAALRVMVRRGHDGFTVTEVAKEVGLSRAAIILRFKGTEALRLRLTAHVVERFTKSLQALPVSRSGDALLQLVGFIGRLLPTPGSLAAFMRSYHASIEAKGVSRLERKRGAALRAAIAERMPEVAIDHDSAVVAFGAHITGSLMQWEALTGVSAHDYLVERTKAWLSLAQIAFDPHFKAHLSPATAAASESSQEST